MPERAIVAWLESSPAEPWWVEERLAPQPSVAGDRDVGRARSCAPRRSAR
ncbi:MAG: hypothetical protein M5U28_10545 [Sandaracinaceae bacterium]|nr:hypothetical protein [Sandaracinaceae bacterium]